MVTIFIRFCLILMLGALSEQALAMDMTDDSAPCSAHTSLPASNPEISHSATQSDHSKMMHHTDETSHNACCKQDCQCPAGACASLTGLQGTSELALKPHQRKPTPTSRFMLPSLTLSALFRPPIAA